MSAPVLFDRDLRRVRRERAARTNGDAFLHERAFGELLDRLGDVKRTFERALLVGCGRADWPDRLRAIAGDVTVSDPSPYVAAAMRGVAADEDRLPFADGSFDLIVAVGTLDGLDDLPGALALFRRILRLDGLLLGALAGAGGLPRLRRAMLAADAVSGRAAPRLHPTLDARTIGDLLARAGLTLPVVDTETVEVSYGGLPQLVADLRGHGAANILVRRSRAPLDRSAYAAAIADFASDATDGRMIEMFEIIHFSGWSPAPTQPRPARRGSATVSLAQALIDKSP